MVVTVSKTAISHKNITTCTFSTNKNKGILISHLRSESTNSYTLQQKTARIKVLAHRSQSEEPISNPIIFNV